MSIESSFTLVPHLYFLTLLLKQLFTLVTLIILSQFRNIQLIVK